MNRKSISLILLASIMAWTFPTYNVAATDKTSAEAGSDVEAADNQVVVLYEEGEMPSEASSAKTESAQDRILEKAQEEILDELIEGDFSVDGTIVLESEDEASEDVVVGVVSSEDYDVEDLSEKLQESDSIKYAEPNYIFKATAIPAWSDIYGQDSWQIGDNGINADEVSEFGASGSGGETVIAVMDTGIDYKHKELKDRMWTEPDGFPLNNKKKHGIDFVVNDRDPMDENGHGTHCAGIIAAAADNGEGVIGVAGKRQDVKLMSVRILDESGSGTLESIVSGFKYLIRAKKAGANIKAVNCSFGAAVTSDIFDEAIEQAGQMGILTVAAAGNDSMDNDKTASSPANCKSDYVIAVAATDEDGELASYSNYGRTMVDVAAPGSNILSTVSYNNYAPYLYDKDRIKETTSCYGEFTGAAVTNGGVGGKSVVPVKGTDYNGNAIDAAGVDGFGASRMLSRLKKGSSGRMELSAILSGAPNAKPFVIGNNKDTLRWSIRDAKRGDEYILYFPYEKQSVGNHDTYTNVAVRTHTERDGGMGKLDVCDVIVDKVDKNGNASWRDVCSEDEESYAYLEVSEDWNSIWHASGSDDALYPLKEVRGIDNTATDGSGYGLGFVYTASRDGDIDVDISSMAISNTNADESEFGKYDVYSGTSMATPTVTGAVALIASMNPDMTAEDLKTTLFAATRDSGASGKWATNGSVDLANYSPTEDSSKPAVSSVTADFAGNKVVLRGRGFGKNPSVDIHYNISGEDKTNVPCSSSQGSITIGNAGAGGLGIIGSDITFKIKNENGKTGQISKYVVKGLKKYDDAFEMPIVQDLMFFEWAKGKPGKSADEIEEWIDEPAEPMMPSGLRYIPGANQILKYAPNGTIHSVVYNEARQIWEVTQRGVDIQAFLTEYAKEAAVKNDYWAADLKENVNYFEYELLASPAYMGEAVYELIRVTIDGSREAVLLIGLDINEGMDRWTVYYDSLTGLGNASGLDFSKYDKTTLAGYKGKLYMIGGAKVNVDEDIDWMAALFGGVDIDDKISATPYKEVYSYEPNVAGSTWTKEASLPESRMLGTAIAQNGKLYYLLASKNMDEMDYSVLRFENGAWSTAGKINEAIFTGYNMSLTEFETGMFIIGISGIGIPCSIGIDDRGILLGGMSFDKSGDTFRFNTATGKIEPLEYSLWGDLADRDVTGGSAGNKFYAEYLNEVTQKAIAKSIPISSGYVKLNKTVIGEGDGSVIGGGSYSKGESSKITITPDSGSYIYYVSSEGLSPNLNKEYLKPTAESKAVHSTTFNATADASLEVYFGKESTKVILAKDSYEKKVGIREIEAYTDGTISDIKWKSSNKKYAKPLGDGTIEFKKAGVGKTVTLTAVSVENPSIQASCTVKILSREKTKFTLKGKKLTTEYSVMIDKLLAKSKTPKKFKAKAGSGKVSLSWKKAKKVSGYIVLRQSGKGRFVQIGEVKAKKRRFVDRTAEKGKIYKYIVVSYKKVKDSEAIMISRPSKVKKVRAK